MRLAVFALCSTLVACSPGLPPPELDAEPLPPPETSSADPEPVASAEPSASASPVEAPPATPGQGVAKPGFTLPPDLDVTAVAGNKDELFVVLDHSGADGGRVARIKRSGEQLVNKGPGGRSARIRAQMVGSEQIGVATGPMGAVAIHRGGAWDFRLAPAIEGEAVGAVAIAKDGTIYAAGREHALYVRKGESWTTHRYGTTTSPQIVEALVDKAGKLVLVGALGEVLRFDGSQFQRLTIGGLSSGALNTPLSSSWVDTKNDTVWAVGGKSLVQIDLGAQKAQIHASKLFFDLDDVHGANTSKGTLILLGTFGKTAIFDGTDWYEVVDDGAKRVWLDVSKAQAYVADAFDFKVLDVKHPWLGTGTSKKL